MVYRRSPTYERGLPGAVVRVSDDHAGECDISRTRDSVRAVAEYVGSRGETGFEDAPPFIECVGPTGMGKTTTTCAHVFQHASDSYSFTGTDRHDDTEGLNDLPAPLKAVVVEAINEANGRARRAECQRELRAHRESISPTFNLGPGFSNPVGHGSSTLADETYAHEPTLNSKITTFSAEEMRASIAALTFMLERGESQEFGEIEDNLSSTRAIRAALDATGRRHSVSDMQSVLDDALQHGLLGATIRFVPKCQNMEEGRLSLYRFHATLRKSDNKLVRLLGALVKSIRHGVPTESLKDSSGAVFEAIDTEGLQASNSREYRDIARSRAAAIVLFVEPGELRDDVFKIAERAVHDLAADRPVLILVSVLSLRRGRLTEQSVRATRSTLTKSLRREIRAELWRRSPGTSEAEIDETVNEAMSTVRVCPVVPFMSPSTPSDFGTWAVLRDEIVQAVMRRRVAMQRSNLDVIQSLRAASESVRWQRGAREAVPFASIARIRGARDDILTNVVESVASAVSENVSAVIGADSKRALEARLRAIAANPRTFGANLRDMARQTASATSVSETDVRNALFQRLVSPLVDTVPHMLLGTTAENATLAVCAELFTDLAHEGSSLAQLCGAIARSLGAIANAMCGDSTKYALLCVARVVVQDFAYKWLLQSSVQWGKRTDCRVALMVDQRRELQEEIGRAFLDVLRAAARDKFDGVLEASRRSRDEGDIQSHLAILTQHIDTYGSHAQSDAERSIHEILTSGDGPRAERLNRFRIGELRRYCNANGVSPVGVKAVLIGRLLGETEDRRIERLIQAGGPAAAVVRRAMERAAANSKRQRDDDEIAEELGGPANMDADTDDMPARRRRLDGTQPKRAVGRSERLRAREL